MCVACHALLQILNHTCTVRRFGTKIYDICEPVLFKKRKVGGEHRGEPLKFKFLLIIIVSLTSFQQQDFKIRPKQFTKPSNSGDCSVALSYLCIYIVFLLLFPLCARLCVWNELNFSAYLHFQFIFATIYESHYTF